MTTTTPTPTTTTTAPSARPPITLERSYAAPVEDLWELWTTKEGFESWWGPAGFRVEVHALEPRVGGALAYDMIAVDPEHIAFMKQAGMPGSHATHGTFVEVTPLRSLTIRHRIDFVPGVAPYDNDTRVEFLAEGASVRMVITVDAHLDEMWTQRATAGWTSQLTKVPAVLAARAQRR